MRTMPLVKRFGARFVSVTLLTAPASVAIACVSSPVDGASVASTSTPIAFGGYLMEPDGQVRLHAIDPAGAISQPHIARTFSSSLPDRTVDPGGRAFPWSISARTIEDRHWRAGTTGRFLQLRLVNQESDVPGRGVPLLTFQNDGGRCMQEHPTDFFERCGSPNSPDLFVYTSDFPAGPDFSFVSGGRDAGYPPRIRLVVRNTGRHGQVTGLRCSRWGGPDLTVASPALPVRLKTGEEKTFIMPGAPPSSAVSTCSVLGTADDGAPETLTLNNLLAPTGGL